MKDTPNSSKKGPPRTQAAYTHLILLFVFVFRLLAPTIDFLLPYILYLALSQTIEQRTPSLPSRVSITVLTVRIPIDSLYSQQYAVRRKDFIPPFRPVSSHILIKPKNMLCILFAVVFLLLSSLPFSSMYNEVAGLGRLAPIPKYYLLNYFTRVKTSSWSGFRRTSLYRLARVVRRIQDN